VVPVRPLAPPLPRPVPGACPIGARLRRAAVTDEQSKDEAAQRRTHMLRLLINGICTDTVHAEQLLAGCPRPLAPLQALRAARAVQASGAGLGFQFPVDSTGAA
jgi:hypothetical protein